LAATAETKTRVAILSVASNALLIIIKVAIGILSGSVAIISEAIHSAVDLIAAVIALFAVRASGQQADEGHPYGHGKYENISGTVEALLIFVAAVWIIYEAVDKLLHPRPVDLVAWGAGVMFLSALVNVLIGRRMSKVAKQTDSVALRADAWHHWTDVYTSAGVMLGLLVIWIVGLVSPGVDLRWLDSVVAIVVALLILKAAWDLTRSSARDLLDASLPDEDVDWIPGFVCKTWPDVRSFHHVRTRKAGSNRFIDFHLAERFAAHDVFQDGQDEGIGSAAEIGDHQTKEIRFPGDDNGSRDELAFVRPVWPVGIFFHIDRIKRQKIHWDRFNPKLP